MTASLSTSEELDALVSRIRACRVCIEAPRGKPLPHEPRPVVSPSSTARILLAGQAPGARVHNSGRPFTDPSGDRLRAWLGVSPEVFYDQSRIAIVAMGFCFPGNDANGGDLPPRPECRALWHDRLFSAMPQIQCLLMIGRPAQLYHLQRLGRGHQIGPNLTETVSRWREIAAGPAPRAFPLPHPSWRNTGWLKRHPWFESEYLPVLRAEVARWLG
jgi:uracil-DNA glycosylase